MYIPYKIIKIYIMFYTYISIGESERVRGRKERHVEEGRGEEGESKKADRRHTTDKPQGTRKGGRQDSRDGRDRRDSGDMRHPDGDEHGVSAQTSRKVP
jgi:hypothetical protein